MPDLTFTDGRPVPAYLSPRQVAELFTISRRHVYHAIKQGDLPCRRFTARQYRIQRSAALEWFSRANK